MSGKIKKIVTLILVLLLTNNSFSESEKLSFSEFGILTKWGYEKESVDNFGRPTTETVKDSWGIFFAKKYNYLYNINQFKAGFYYGFNIEIIAPPEFEFSPSDEVFISPLFVLEPIQLGASFKLPVAENFFLFNAGLSLTLAGGFSTADYSDSNLPAGAPTESYTYSLGYGITPHIGVKYFFSEKFSIGIGFRFSDVELTPRVVVDDETKKGEDFDEDFGSMYFSITY
jgi:hypothetical protein